MGGGFWAGLGLALDNIYRKFYRMLNNAKKPFNSIFNSIFLRIIHSKKLFIYFFKELFIQRKIHSKKLTIIYSKNYSFRKKWELFIQKIIQLGKNYSTKYSFKKFENYSFKKIIHFFEKMIIAQGYPNPLCRG